MGTQWQLVRVSQQTLDLLKMVRDGMQRSHERKLITLDLGPHGEVSLDQVVRELCYSKLKHQARALTADAKRRAARRRAVAGELPS